MLIFRNYLKDEHLDKKQSQLDLTQWNMLHVDEKPLQMNSSDCGMFTCKYAEFLSRGKTAFSFDEVKQLKKFFTVFYL